MPVFFLHIILCFRRHEFHFLILPNFNTNLQTRFFSVCNKYYNRNHTFHSWWINISKVITQLKAKGWKLTMENIQINVTSVNIHLLMQAIWGNIWKRTVEKRQTNATNVTMHPLTQAIWGDIWKSTVEKSQINKRCIWIQKKWNVSASLIISSIFRLSLKKMWPGKQI